MNPSNLYEQAFGGVSRMIKKYVTEAVDNLGDLDTLSAEQVEQVFHIVTNGLEYFGTEQYYSYMQASVAAKHVILKEIYHKECYIYYKVSSDRKAPDILNRIKGTMYEHKRVKYYTSPDATGVRKLSETDVKIMPQYIILLSKTPEDYLATSSPKTNHFDLPVSVGPKIRQNIPYKNSPTRVLSETETRLYRNYCGPEAIAELKDRANSIETHKLMYRNLLTAAQPTNVDTLVNREDHPLGTDKSLELLESVLNVAGIDLAYTPGK